MFATRLVNRSFRATLRAETAPLSDCFADMRSWQERNQQTPCSNAIVMVYNSKTDLILKSRGHGGEDPALGKSKKDPTKFASLRVRTLSSECLKWISRPMDSDAAADVLCANINGGNIKVENVQMWYFDGVEQGK